MELFRIFKNKKFIAAVILLLLINCVSFYITQQKNLDVSGININTYSDIFRKNSDVFLSPDAKKTITDKNSRFQILRSFADSEKMKSENTEEYEFYADEEAQLIKEHPQLYEEYKSGKYNHEKLTALSDFYSHFACLLEYQNTYKSNIDSIIENGRDLSSKKLFADKNSYSYKSIQRAAGDFKKNKNIDVSLVNDLPVSAVLNYRTGDFILILLCVFMAISFVSEKEVNLLINTCKNGRIKLKLKQLPVLILFSVFGSAIIYLSEILISIRIYNAPLDLYAPIQSADMFFNCILHINFLQLFIIHILFKSLVAIMISLIIWLLISINRNIILVSGIAGAITGAELLLYKNISYQSNLSFFKTFNIFSLFDYKCITDYNLIPVFSIPVRAERIVWILVLFIGFIASAALITSARHNYPIKTPNKAFGKLHILFNKLSELYAKLQSFLYAGRFETFKIMHIGKGLLTVIAFIIIIGFSFNTSPLVFSSTEIFLSDFYEQYGGELNQKAYDRIEEMQAELDKVNEEFGIKNAEFINGKISFDEYELAKAKKDAYDTQQKAVDELTQQIERIAPLADKGIKPILMNETGYNNLFYYESNQSEILLLICAVIIIFSSVFSIEKSSNMLIMNHCTKKGRKELYYKKILCILPKTFVLTLISCLSLIIQNNYLYTLDNLNADIRNLQCLENIGMNITILEYIILNFVFEFIFITVVGLITASLSAFISQIGVIIASGCVFILPSALYMIKINSVKGISASFLFNFNSFILDKSLSASSFILHFALIVIGVILLYLCQREWCLTKER